MFPDLSYRITGICYDVQNELGRFSREKQYCDLLEAKLTQAGLPYSREYRMGKSGNILDFVINGTIVLEAKAKQMLLKEDYYQIQRYLQSSGYKLGLLVNFQSRFLKPKRIIRIETDTRSRYA